METMLNRIIPPLIGALIGWHIGRFIHLKEMDKKPVSLYRAFIDQKKGLKKCPRCGYEHIYLCEIGAPKRWSRYFRQCFYCRFKSRAVHTKHGANRLWNKSTTVIGVYEERGDFEWMRNIIK